MKRFHTSDWRPGDVLSTVDMVAQRRDGPRWQRELDDDDECSMQASMTQPTASKH